MQIFVNDQKLDARLADERTVEEVYEAVNRWSADQKKYILNLKVDSEEVSMSRLKERATDDVNRLDFYIGDEIDMVLTTLAELNRYLDQIGSILFEKQSVDSKDMTHLVEGIHWMIQIMGSVSSILHIDLNNTFSPFESAEDEKKRSIAMVLDELKTIAKNANDKPAENIIGRFLQELRHLKAFAETLTLQVGSINAGREELLEVVEEFETEIPGLVKEIVSINIDFNSGNDKKALEALGILTNKLSRYISALFALDHQLRRNQKKGTKELEVDGESFSDCAAALTGLLKDISSALEDQDIVAVGDIMEYELTEQLQIVQKFLPKICSRASADI